MQIARRRAETIARQPQFNIARSDLPDLREPASRPVGLDSADDERLSLNGFRLLMLNGFQIAVAQFGQRELSLRAVNLPLLLTEYLQSSLGQRRVGCLQSALDVLALDADWSIINAVG